MNGALIYQLIQAYGLPGGYKLLTFPGGYIYLRVEFGVIE